MVSLSKGGNVSLSKLDPSLVKAIVGLGWKPRNSDGAAFDLDVSVFLLNKDGKVRSDNDFVFYNNLKAADGSVEHTGDNRDGEGEGDDETVKVNLKTVAQDVDKLVFVVTIHDAAARAQNFGQVGGAYIRIVNEDGVRNVDGELPEIARYDLSEDYSTETALLFGELYRHNGEWKFRAVGQGYSGGLAAVCAQYGIRAS